jgi:hypothetical protein
MPDTGESRKRQIRGEKLTIVLRRGAQARAGLASALAVDRNVEFR